MIFRHLALATSLVAVAAPAAAQQQGPIAQAVKLADWQLAHMDVNPRSGDMRAWEPAVFASR